MLIFIPLCTVVLGVFGDREGIPRPLPMTPCSCGNWGRWQAPTRSPTVTIVNEVALLVDGHREKKKVSWTHSDFKATTAKQFATDCSWAPLRRLPADSTIPSLWYDFLADIYKRALETGHLYTLYSGGLLCLWREGRICPHDNDLDFYFKDLKGKKEVYDYLMSTPKYRGKMGTHDCGYGAITNLGIHTRDQLGTGCACSLPDGRKTACAEDVADYVPFMFGPAWWIPVAGSKSSIIAGKEGQKQWVGPYARSILKEVDSNKNGKVDQEEVQARATQMHIKPDVVKMAIQHLNYVLQLNRNPQHPPRGFK